MSRAYSHRTPGEKLRDDVVVVYPEWQGWSRLLKRIFILMPSYGTGADGIMSMCEEMGLTFDDIIEKVQRQENFVEAMKEYEDNGFKYRESKIYEGNQERYRHFSVKWSHLQHVYMMESAMPAFIKAEKGSVSAPEAKLIERSGLLGIENIVHQQKQPSVTENGATTYGESTKALYDLDAQFSGE